MPDDIELPPGTPLLLDYHDSKWRNVFVISESFGKIKIRYEGYSDTWDKSLDRNKFLIKDSTQKKLGDEEVAAGFAKNLETNKSASSVAAFVFITDLCFPSTPMMGILVERVVAMP